MCTELDFDKIMLTCVTVLLCYCVAVRLGSDSMEERMVQSSQDQTGAVKVAAKVQLRSPPGRAGLGRLIVKPWPQRSASQVSPCQTIVPGIYKSRHVQYSVTVLHSNPNISIIMKCSQKMFVIFQ